MTTSILRSGWCTMPMSLLMIVPRLPRRAMVSRTLVGGLFCPRWRKFYPLPIKNRQAFAGTVVAPIRPRFTLRISEDTYAPDLEIAVGGHPRWWRRHAPSPVHPASDRRCPPQAVLPPVRRSDAARPDPATGGSDHQAR